MTPDFDDYRPAVPRDPATERRDAVLARFGQEVLAQRGPRQRQLADAIYQRLRDGAEVDDVKHLIADLSRTAAEDHRSRKAGRRAGGAW